MFRYLYSAGISLIVCVLSLAIYHVYLAPTPVNQHFISQHSTPTRLSGFQHISSDTDFRNASRATLPAVVHIKSTSLVSSYQPYYDPFQNFFGDDFFGRQKYRQQDKQVQSSGSGVIIRSNGYIVTNHHVVNGADLLEVTLNDNRTFKAELVGTDPSTDLALLKIEGEDYPIISLSNSDEVEVGEWVLAVGNPFNLSSTVTAGIVSAKGRNINILKEKSAIESFIQTDAAVNPGNSGGALVNLDGNLIGINTAIATPTGTYAGYSFAVPANIVARVVEDLITYGQIQRAYLGITMADINSEIASSLDLKVTEGVLVESVFEGTAAENSGLKTGDVITHLEDIGTKTSSELLGQLGKYSPGDKAKLSVIRKGKQIELPVTLRNEKGGFEPLKKEENALVVLGIKLEELSRNEKARLGLRYGLKVTQIGKGLISANTNMKKGFIVTGVNKQATQSVGEFEKLAGDISQGVILEGYYPGYRNKFYYAVGR